MKRGLATLGVTILVIVALLALTQPAGAVLATLSGPDQIEQPDNGSFSATIELQEDERIPIEHVNVTFTAADSPGSLTAVFTPDGDLKAIHTEGDIDDQINVTVLEESLKLTPVERHADFGYGYLSGTDERTSEEFSFGYGYGYGYGDGEQPSLGFELSLASTAFAPGEYSVILDVNTGEDSYASNEMSFEILPEDVDAAVRVTPETLNKASNGKWVTAHIQLADHDASEIDISSVELNGVPAVDDPKYGFVTDPEITNDGKVMVKFSRDAVADTLEIGDGVTVTVTGTVGDATFTAEDTIRVIDRGGQSSVNTDTGDRNGGPPGDDDRGSSGNGPSSVDGQAGDNRGGPS